MWINTGSDNLRPTSNYDEEEVEAFYMDLEKFYKEDHTFFKVIIGDFNAKTGPRRSEERHIGTHGLEWNEQVERLSEFTIMTETIHVNRRLCLTDVAFVPKFYTGSDHRLLRARFYFSRKGEKDAKFKNRIPRTTINWDLFNSLVGCWEDAVVDNIDEEYDRLIQHLHVSAMKAERLKVTKRRLSPETLAQIRQRGIARAAGNRELTSELAEQCRHATKEDLRKRKATVMAEAAEAGKSIPKVHRSFANYMAKMIALRRPDGTVIASRKAMEKTIHEYYSDLFDSQVHLPLYKIKEDGYVAPPILPSEIRHAISSVKNPTVPGPDRTRPEHLKSLPPVLINTLARLPTRYLSECKVPTQWKTSETVLLFKKGDLHDNMGV
ncbi:unnamed protein product [Angiostrongylus costaricensis]|uniref:Endo/exonuclease/phosphatase domain-containing protein n=1 Tax=Angiostrongylus costaricensis TaxID=334426 RepID=A0A0R3PKU7_ANGCS|nr:unnamed protein product [Angiostrongylus costaricensis]